jgi:hypothetical protein
MRRCARWCGRGCTQAEYEKAKKLSNEITAKLGAKWRPHTWENLGWHSGSVSVCGRLNVYPSYGAFSAFLGEPGKGGRWVGRGRTPRSAVRNVVAMAVLELRELQVLLGIK